MSTTTNGNDGNEPPKILDGTSEMIRNWLGDRAGVPINRRGSGRKIASKTLASRLPDRDFEFGNLIPAVYDRITHNSRKVMERSTVSEGTWCWREPRGYPTHADTAPHPSGKTLDERRAAHPEVALERAIAGMLRRRGIHHWSNQIPTCSGVSGPSSGKTQNIDLAEWDEDEKTMTLVELKGRGSKDNPVAAAFQLIGYALLLLLSRETFGTGRGIPINDPRWHRASRLSLRVFAPQEFYWGYSLIWFEKQLTDALHRFDRSQDLRITGFAFRAFPDVAGWLPENEVVLHNLLDPSNANGAPRWKSET